MRRTVQTQAAVAATGPVTSVRMKEDQPTEDFPAVSEPEPATSSCLSSSKLSLRQWLLASLIPLGVTLVLALVTGLVINHNQFGSVSGGSPKYGESSDLTSSVSALNISCLSLLLGASLALVRLAFLAYVHKRLVGIFNFVIYITLSAVLVWFVYSGQVTEVILSEAIDLATQVQTAFGGEFEWEDSKFPTTFADISSAGDFYNWMRGPLKSVMTAGVLNRANGFSAATNNMPTQLNDPTFQTKDIDGSTTGGSTHSYGVWTVPQCDVRQVRVQLQDMNEPQIMRQDVNATVEIGPEPFPFYVQVTTEFSLRVPSYEDSLQDTTVRPFRNANSNVSSSFKETFTSNTFTNAWGMEQGAADFTGLSGIVYPGKSGQVMSTQWTVNNHTAISMIHGKYYPLISDADVVVATVGLDIDSLENNVWIDGRTSMVQVGCYIWNSNSNLNAFAFYTVEFLPTGKVLPNPSFVTISRFNDQTLGSLDPGFVFVYYFLAVEIQDLILEGVVRYFVDGGWCNLIDSCAIITTFTMSVARLIAISMLTSSTSAHYWTRGKAQDTLGIVSGLALFMVTLKLLKFTRNVPIMCRICDTFGAVMVSIALFLVVMLLIFVAFGMLFQLIFCLNMGEFESLGKSVFNIFRAMNGDLDVDTIAQVQPTVGPILYCCFVVLTVFVAFTILIAIISDSYESVKEMNPSEGFWVSISDKLKEGWLTIGQAGGEGQTEAAEDSAAEEGEAGVFRKGQESDSEMMRAMQQSMLDLGTQMAQIQTQMAFMCNQQRVASRAAVNDPLMPTKVDYTDSTPLSTPVSTRGQELELDVDAPMHQERNILVVDSLEQPPLEYALTKIVEQKLPRFDFDDSGTINGDTELTQLTTHMAFHLHGAGRKPTDGTIPHIKSHDTGSMTPETIETSIAQLTSRRGDLKHRPMFVPEYVEWLIQEFHVTL